jgi:hypothetical protein
MTDKHQIAEAFTRGAEWAHENLLDYETRFSRAADYASGQTQTPREWSDEVRAQNMSLRVALAGAELTIKALSEKLRAEYARLGGLSK